MRLVRQPTPITIRLFLSQDDCLRPEDSLGGEGAGAQEYGDWGSESVESRLRRDVSICYILDRDLICLQCLSISSTLSHEGS
jgi:hypothetical protein